MIFRTAFLRLFTTGLCFLLTITLPATAFADELCPEGISPANSRETLLKNILYFVEHESFADSLNPLKLHCYFYGDIKYEKAQKYYDKKIGKIYTIYITNILPDLPNYRIFINPFTNSFGNITGLELKFAGTDEFFYPENQLKEYFTTMKITKKYMPFSYSNNLRYGRYEPPKTTPTLYRITASKCFPEKKLMLLRYERSNNDDPAQIDYYFVIDIDETAYPTGLSRYDYLKIPCRYRNGKTGDKLEYKSIVSKIEPDEIKSDYGIRPDF